MFEIEVFYFPTTHIIQSRCLGNGRLQKLIHHQQGTRIFIWGAALEKIYLEFIIFRYDKA